MLHWLAQAATGDPIVDWVTRAGPVGILALIVMLFIRGDLVPRRTLDEALKQRDRALELVYDQAAIAGRAVDLSKQRLDVERQALEIRQKEK